MEKTKTEQYLVDQLEGTFGSVVQRKGQSRNAIVGELINLYEDFPIDEIKRLASEVKRHHRYGTFPPIGVIMDVATDIRLEKPKKRAGSDCHWPMELQEAAKEKMEFFNKWVVRDGGMYDLCIAYQKRLDVPLILIGDMELAFWDVVEKYFTLHKTKCLKWRGTFGKSWVNAALAWQDWPDFKERFLNRLKELGEERRYRLSAKPVVDFHKLADNFKTEESTHA